MNNVHRLVVPTRDETRSLPAQAIRRTGEVLILPCVRYERIEAEDGQHTRRGSAASHEPIRQDLTA